MMSQIKLDYYVGTAGEVHPLLDSANSFHEGSAPALTLTQAIAFARVVVGGMALGREFTCRELFAGVRLRFERRNLAQAILPLRGVKIMSSGVRKEPRENGNDGYSTVWKVIK
jgi:hypothetical protein